MKMRFIATITALLFVGLTQAQEPVITSWLQNMTVTGTFYVTGNSTAMDNNILVNCQQVEYSDDYVYVHATGVPAYATGPFQDGNPSNAQDQDAIYRFTLDPQPSIGANTESTPGNIGVFVNGVSLFDYRDGVAWNPQTNALCGGPGNPMCPGGPGSSQDWNRDAIPAEMGGFDCSKAHPAMGNYHHHQNPSAFDLDVDVVSDICNLYDADGLYAINAAEHSPLLGFAYDGYPIYGAYGFANTDGTGGITRIKSSYELRDITTRTTHADGSSVDQGPDISPTYWLGYFREDYGWVEHTGEEDYLDEHNGRECITPEYPDGTYAYFCTVDEDWNSAYPYVVGPTFYGEYSNASVTSVTEPTTIYTGVNSLDEGFLNGLDMNIFPNPSSDLVAMQVSGLLRDNLQINVFDIEGRLVYESQLNKGSTIWHWNTRTVYAGQYIMHISDGFDSVVRQLSIVKD